MTKIQKLYVGGTPAGGFRFTDKGKNVSTANQRVRSTPEKSREDRQKDIGKIMKEMREDKDFKKKRKEFESKKENQNENRQQQEVKGAQTTDFLEDLKDAYKAGLFTGGTKTKEFMAKYNLDPSDIVKLRSGIDRGLGINMRTGTNVLEDIVGNLQQEGILRDFGTPSGKVFKTAQDVFEPGMKKSNIFLPFEDPQNIFEQGANLATQFNPAVNLLAGIFGSSAAQRATYFGKEKGLKGEELDNFAAAVANDRNLYNQMMSTPLMQDYELNEFRAEANRQAMANRQGKGDPDPISGTQPNEDDEGTSTTNPGSETFTPQQQQNFFTFFDPSIGRYRSGSYDDYLKFVTVKDGGIIKLQQGGALPNAPGGVASEKVKKELDELFDARKEIQELDAPTESEKKGAQMIMSDIDDKAKAISERAQEGIMSRLKDQSARDIFMASNPDIGPPLREDLKLLPRLKDSGISLLMEALRKSDISTGSANQYLEEALNNFVAAGIIPPNTSYNQLTDPFKDLVTREAARIAEAENMRQEINMFKEPRGRGGFKLEEPIYEMQEGKPEDFEQINPVLKNARFPPEPDRYRVADGGIIGLKKGGMNDMMDADSLMFKDPSDEGEWEYNV
jgi:hypothetical protein|tara:strand:- start:273 stop:2129 length:1857 start_codon:yes stop_codon:yes gene_type:complete